MFRSPNVRARRPTAAMGKGGKAGHFQVKLGGDWKDYKEDEDKILKRGFMAGFPNARFTLRGQHYTYDFKRMKQVNQDTGKEREIRCPHGWKQPSKPIVPPGPTMTVTVPAGAPGKSIEVPHPKDPSKMITVQVPAKSKPGQAMLVPVPPLPEAGAGGAPAAAAEEDKKGGGWSTGAKVAGATAATGMVVGGAVLGMAVAEHGVEGTADIIADGAADAGEVIADVAGDAGAAIGDAFADAGGTGAVDAVGEVAGDAAADIGEFGADASEFMIDAADSAGDFIMDLF